MTTSTDVPTLDDLVDTQRRLVAHLQASEMGPDRVSAPLALTNAIDKLSTLERLRADMRPLDAVRNRHDHEAPRGFGA